MSPRPMTRRTDSHSDSRAAGSEEGSVEIFYDPPLLVKWQHQAIEDERKKLRGPPTGRGPYLEKRLTTAKESRQQLMAPL